MKENDTQAALRKLSFVPKAEIPPSHCYTGAVYCLEDLMRHVFGLAAAIEAIADDLGRDYLSDNRIDALRACARGVLDTISEIDRRTPPS